MSTMLTRLVMALLLFTQLAMAAQACELPSHSPSAAFANDEPCHDPENGTANVCLAHCLQSSQTLDANPLDCIAAPVSFIVIAFDFSAPSFPTRSLPVRISDPPASIRFCSFQI